MKINDIPGDILKSFRDGVVIPAHPLAIDADGRLDTKHQKALIRYYMDAGAGGVAVGVHTTQFEIRKPEIGLFEPVLELCSNEVDSYGAKTGKNIFKVAGICGKTDQAIKEAEFAISKGYHAGLLSLAAFAKDPFEDMLNHCKAIAKVIPVMGFYLQPAVGGRILPYEFWREFAMIDNVIAIKMAPFNRYQSFDVVRGVCDAGRESDITLYTGNDDNILIDLLTEYKIKTSQGTKTIRIKGGLLGHWAVWTKKAVEILEKAKQISSMQTPVSHDMLTLAVEITDTNAAFFDAANAFKGCIAGIHEVLRRQGLMKGIWCLNPDEKLSSGQSEEIDRIYEAYPHLNDDDFVKANLDKWLNDKS